MYSIFTLIENLIFKIWSTKLLKIFVVLFKFSIISFCLCNYLYTELNMLKVQLTVVRTFHVSEKYGFCKRSLRCNCLRSCAHFVPLSLSVLCLLSDCWKCSCLFCPKFVLCRRRNIRNHQWIASSSDVLLCFMRKRLNKPQVISSSLAYASLKELLGIAVSLLHKKCPVHQKK